LQVRVAVHTGLAVVGHLADGTDPDAIRVGETPNIAARLQNIAEPLRRSRKRSRMVLARPIILCLRGVRVDRDEP
jgi:class 3 adenylate cyclase